MTQNQSTTTASTTDNTRSERMEQAHALLTEGLGSVRSDTEALARYLRFRSHFHSYSRHNTMLIFVQRPSACYCMGYRAWQKQGRQVRRGETGIMIWAPLLRRPTAEEVAAGADPDKRLVRGYRVAYTFDYAQTDAVADDALVYESPVPKLGTEAHVGLCLDLQAVATHWGYHLTESGGYAEGYCDWKRKVIGLRAGLAADDRAAVLAHELAHAAAHVPSPKGQPPESERLTHAEREIQAEGAAFMALYALGLDTSRAALPYLKSYAGDDEALWHQLGAIEKIAGVLLGAVAEVQGCKETALAEQ